MTFGRKIGGNVTEGNGTKREQIVALGSHGGSLPSCLIREEGDKSRSLLLSNHNAESKGLPMATALKEEANCS
jgi:hypothetical protein